MATGSQWDLIQVFAWGRMVTNYSRTLPLASAVSKTFDGEMCAICRMVDDARRQEQPQRALPGSKFDSKILIFFQQPPAVTVETHPTVAWFPIESAIVAGERQAPPVPPPRAELA